MSRDISKIDAAPVKFSGADVRIIFSFVEASRPIRRALVVLAFCVSIPVLAAALDRARCAGLRHYTSTRPL